MVMAKESIKSLPKVVLDGGELHISYSSQYKLLGIEYTPVGENKKSVYFTENDKKIKYYDGTTLVFEK